VVANGRDKYQGERLRILFNKTLIDDVAVTTVLPAWETFEFDLPPITPGEHTITLENSGSGGLTFDHVQVLPTGNESSLPVPYPALSDGLVAYYPFNGNADDESGNGNHGTVYGATLTADRFGTPNSAYSFDGDDYILTSLNMTEVWDVGDPIHLSLWIKTTAKAGAALAGKPGGGPDFTAVLEPDGSGRLRARLYGGVNAASDVAVNDGQWHYICWGTNGTTSYYYIDGKPQSDAPSIGSHNREIAVMLGASKDPPRNFFEGTIDDVRIYNRALSKAEIGALYGENGDQGLVAYYPFNGNADDESGSGNHGMVYSATLTADRFGKPNSAYAFDGVDDYIEIADSASLDIEQQITIAAWVRFYSNPDGSSRIVDKSHTNCRAPWNMYGLRMCCKASQFAFDVTTYGSNHISNSSSDYPSDAWHSVVGTYDGSAQKLYVNGILDSSASVGGSIEANNEPLLIGKHRGCESQHFDGLIDDVRIYNRALSEAEVRALYYREQDDGLVAYYPFNGNANDESGNGNHGTVHGATLAVDRFGNSNSAYAFDGIDDYIAIPDNPTLEISEEVTLSAWVSVSSLEGGEGIVSKVWTNSRSPWELGIDTGTERLRFMGSSDYRQPSYNAIDDEPVRLEQWYHIAGTTSDGLAILYINGTMAASEAYSGTLWENDYDVFIGTRWTHNQDSGHFFDGLIDDVRIYSRALSEAEVQALYEQER
jgi:hypothetical protein